MSDTTNPPRNAPSLTVEEAHSRLFEMGYEGIETEVHPSWASVFVWRAFDRRNGHAEGGYTVGEAFRNAVAWAESVAKEDHR